MDKSGNRRTFTHSHLSWPSTIFYQLPPSIMIHSIFSVQFLCLTVFCTTSLQVVFGLLVWLVVCWKMEKAIKMSVAMKDWKDERWHSGYQRSSGKMEVYDRYIESFIENLSVKEFWKSICNSRSYDQKSNTLLFSWRRCMLWHKVSNSMTVVMALMLSVRGQRQDETVVLTGYLLVTTRREDPIQVMLAGLQIAFGTHAGIHLGPSDTNKLVNF